MAAPRVTPSDEGTSAVTTPKIAVGPHPSGRVSPTALTPHLCLIAERILASGSDLATRTADEVLRAIPAYHGVPWEQVRDQALANLERASTTLISAKIPSPDEVNEASVADVRASQGVPVQDVLHAYRISLALIKDELTRISEDVPGDAVIMGIYLLWETADVVADQLAVHHQEAEIRAARRDERFLIDTLTRLLSGTVTASELRKGAAHLRLPRDGPVLVLRASAQEREKLLSLKSFITRKHCGQVGAAPLLGLIDGNLAGIVRELPDLAGIPVTIGAAWASDVKAVPSAWVEATHAMETARIFGLRGVHQFADLALRTVVVSQKDVGRLLWERYFAVLGTDLIGRDLFMQSVGALFNHGMNINRAAVSIHVHPNTLRHRLHRFQEKTDCDLENFESAMEVWWALQYSRTLINTDSEQD